MNLHWMYYWVELQQVLEYCYEIASATCNNVPGSKIKYLNPKHRNKFVFRASPTDALASFWLVITKIDFLMWRFWLTSHDKKEWGYILEWCEYTVFC